MKRNPPTAAPAGPRRFIRPANHGRPARVLFVAAAEPEGAYATYYRPTPDGRPRRFMSPDLPPQASFRAAQLDLNAYALRHRLETACPCCDRGDEYNGFDSGPMLFLCPNHCACHD